MNESSSGIRGSALVLLACWVVSSSPAGVQAAQDEAAKEIARQARAYQRAKDPVDRKAALEAVAQIGKGCTNDADRKAAARALAAGLKDEAIALRATTIALLVDGQDRDVAVDALLASAREVAKEIASIEAGLDKRRPELDLKPERPKPVRDDDFARTLRSLDKGLDSVQLVGRSVGLSALCSNYVAAFVAIEDDRSVEGLGALAEVLVSSDPLHHALTRLGTATCLRHAAANLAMNGELRAWNHARAEKVRAYRIGKKPSWFEGDAQAWQAREEQRIAKILAPLEEAITYFDGWAEPIVAR